MKNLKKKFISAVLSAAIGCTVVCYTPVWKNNKTDAASVEIERALQWAIEIANDNTHGYSQANRNGPDYDCSSLVGAALNHAGFNGTLGFNTRNMGSILTGIGFTYIPGTADLQRGDILWRSGHTEMYLGDGMNVGAHRDYGHPETGDQNGKEISVAKYSESGSWSGVYRYGGGVERPVIAEVVADHKFNTYDMNRNIETNRWVDKGDKCKIFEVYGDGFELIEYPTSSGSRIALARCGDLSIPGEEPTTMPTSPPPHPQTQSPIGHADYAFGGVGKFSIAGWAFDPDAMGTMLDIHVYMDGKHIKTVKADQLRKDVDNAHHCGTNHGYASDIAASPGKHVVQTAAIDVVGGNNNTWLESYEITVTSKTESPKGALDYCKGGIDVIHVGGWGFDPDNTGAAADVLVYMGASKSNMKLIKTIKANKVREDVDRVHKCGKNHGFDEVIPVTATTGKNKYYVKVEVKDTNGNPNKVFNSEVTVTGTQKPKGTLDYCNGGTDQFHIAGWAFDPDNVNETSQILVYFGKDEKTAKIVKTIKANKVREDVDKAYKCGKNHGFDEIIGVTSGPGKYFVKIEIKDTNNNPNRDIKGKYITITSSPKVNRDAFYGDVGKVYVRGWAFDPDDINAKLKVKVFLGNSTSRGTCIGTLTADKQKVGLNKTYGCGDFHGFEGTLKASPGKYYLRLYAQDSGKNPEKKIDCGYIAVPVSNTQVVKGYVDAVSEGSKNIFVRGWAFDPDKTDASVDVQLYMDGKLVTTLKANKNKSGLNGTYGCGNNHGFEANVPLSVTAGKHRMKLIAVDVYGYNLNKTIYDKNITIYDTQSPKGYTDVGTGGSKSVYVRGWAFDPDKRDAQLNVQVYLGNTFVSTIKANKQKNGLNNAHGCGDAHGFEATIPVSVNPGKYVLKIVAVDASGNNSNKTIYNKEVTITK